jgi:SNARE associated Golgi protein
LEGNGMKIMLLLRLSPLIPFNALDYISGVTSISLQTYSLALVGIIPGTVTFCYIGATASSFRDGTTSASNNKTLHSIILVFGVIFALAGVAIASYYSKIELDRMLHASRDSPDFLPLDTTGAESRIQILNDSLVDDAGVPSMTAAYFDIPPQSTTSLT